MIEKKCNNCGGKLIECTFSTGVFSAHTVSIPNGYNFPTVNKVNSFICEKCGNITFYADMDSKTK